jgi:hypothetical protein
LSVWFFGVRSPQKEEKTVAGDQIMSRYVESSNTRIRFEELMEREKTSKAKAKQQKPDRKITSNEEKHAIVTSALPAKNPSVIEAMMDVVEDQCKAGGGNFSCRPSDLLPLIDKKPHGPYHPDFLRVLRGNYLENFAATLENLRSRFASRGIHFACCREWTPSTLIPVHFKMTSRP